MNIQTIIRERLAPLHPVTLEIIDDSASHAGHAGARDHAARTGAHDSSHFELTIVSPVFLGQSSVARHRMIYDLLGDLMQTRIHALKIDARAQ
ncbi:MAG: BolA family transcriptional regulator [Betaproteobacteria bacterium]|nr:BolA family transcriptional regulator [Betaproteobacteria bacterium]